MKFIDKIYNKITVYYGNFKHFIVDRVFGNNIGIGMLFSILFILNPVPVLLVLVITYSLYVAGYIR